MTDLIDEQTLSDRIYNDCDLPRNMANTVARVTNAILDLLTQNAPLIAEAMTDCDGKISVSIPVKLETVGKNTSVKTKLSFGVKHTDERDDLIENDANQVKMEL